MLTHWDTQTEILIQLGDLIDRGKGSPEVVKLTRQLQRKYPNQTVFLRGNHEYEIIDHMYVRPNINWLQQGGEGTLQQYLKAGRDVMDDVNWFNTMPLFWENDSIFVSHAGISESAINPFNQIYESSILWNRGPLRNIRKLQIIGHTPCDSPIYDPRSNSWNIDTAAVFGNFLTGVKLKQTGEIIEWVKIRADKRDVKEKV
jgi:serine/threonine protein phosphatase 1